MIILLNFGNNKYMKKKRKIELILPLCLVFFFCVSIISIYTSTSILPSYYAEFHIKQIVWYISGFIIFTVTLLLGNEKIYRYSSYFYVASIILLVLVLLIGNEVNNARAWISIGALNIQPTEIAKLGLIIYLAKVLNDYHFSDKKDMKSEFKIILKVLLITFIPCILAFIEPDTGSVISYFIIAFIMIFISGIRGRWFILFFIVLGILTAVFVTFYINYPTKFISIFGDSFYYRIYRFTDWQVGSGMQLENSLISIATSGTFGHGINNIPLYFPEPYTDFIFTVFVSNFGLIGSISLLLIIFIFDTRIVSIGLKSTKTIDKYLIAGVMGALIYPQIQNIAMTVGLLPITGVTLPFISYGGSSLIVSFIMISLVINVYKRKSWI